MDGSEILINMIKIIKLPDETKTQDVSYIRR